MTTAAVAKWTVGPEAGTAIEQLEVPWSSFIPVSPTPKQLAFLLLPSLEALYGGSAGGGKSIALLMAALQYVDHPGYSALILRKSYTDLALPGALMDKAGEWLGGTAAQPKDGGKSWEFPSGASLTFGYVGLDGAPCRASIVFSRAPQRLDDGRLAFDITLPPRGRDDARGTRPPVGARPSAPPANNALAEALARAKRG